jgi:hypothetical protein
LLFVPFGLKQLRMQTNWIKRASLLVALTVVVCAHDGGARRIPADAESRAVAFLSREVPAWSKQNGWFSCHNNGDAARALFVAAQKGRRVPADILSDTMDWIRRPDRWDKNKGDPGFSDKRLADIQFAAALLVAFDAGHVKDRRPLEQAARRLVADQGADGSWKIDTGTAPGSPVTYGTTLATYMALNILRGANLPETRDAIERAERWLGRASPNNLPSAAALTLASTSGFGEPDQSKKEQWLKLFRATQTADGGWGPYPDSPPEAFDTALALLALTRYRREPDVDELIRRGRNFLTAQQNPDGSWRATTRPPGGISYAQLVSTTGWATLALLETRE